MDPINRKSIASILIFFILISSLSTVVSCSDYVKNSTHAGVALSSIRNGESLAGKYCQSCHLLPHPSLLDTKSWEKGVLPQMGPRLGIFKNGFQDYPTWRHDRFLDSNYYPPHPLLTQDEWQDIVNYFVATSPDSLTAPKRVYPVKNGLSLFTVEIPAGDYQNSATSYVRIVPGKAPVPIMIADAVKQSVYLVSDKLQITDSLHTGGHIVDIDFLPGGMLACNIGVLNPNNGRFGKASFLHTGAQGKIQEDTTAVISGLQRPVQLSSADLNNDGKPDVLTCEFGFLTGSLSWMENTGDHKYIRHVLRPVPGALKAYINDYNHDGLPDIWVLFAQGEEGVFLFTNKGHGNFTQEEILRFPSVYGSSYFELDDFNKDGYPDIIYTCGDNADYSTVFKPYHGIYIFINDRTNHFVQKFFYPMNGCYKAMARDFDNDGDLDIAAISFFADYAHQPEEGFVYLKNNGNFNFVSYTKKECTLGRWLVMDAGDIDGDGRTDIILGNFSIKQALNQPAIDWKKSPPFIVLKNTGE